MFKQIIVTLDRFEGDFAVLRHKNHEILWPVEDIPSDSVEGSIITLTAMNEKQAQKSRTEMAKTILNDILNESIGAPGTTPPTLEQIETAEEADLKKINKKLDDINNTLKGK